MTLVRFDTLSAPPGGRTIGGRALHQEVTIGPAEVRSPPTEVDTGPTTVPELPRRRDEAVTALYRAQYGSLIRLAILLVDDIGTAEDVVQDAFASLHRRWFMLRDKNNALFYLRAAVANGARDRLRHRRVARQRDVEEPRPQSSPEEVALVHEQSREVLSRLARLPMRQRQVLVLLYFQDYSEGEIAATLQISRGSVKAHAHRGLARLEAELGGTR